MQSRHECNLKAHYAIRFCVKLDKNARETYEILQIAYGLTCMSRASVFHWHKRVQGQKNGDEKCGREKNVRILELVEKFTNFLDEVHVYKDNRYTVSVATVYRIIHEYLNMLCKVCSQGAQ